MKAQFENVFFPSRLGSHIGTHLLLHSSFLQSCTRLCLLDKLDFFTAFKRCCCCWSKPCKAWQLCSCCLCDLLFIFSVLHRTRQEEELGNDLLSCLLSCNSCELLCLLGLTELLRILSRKSLMIERTSDYCLPPVRCTSKKDRRSSPQKGKEEKDKRNDSGIVLRHRNVTDCQNQNLNSRLPCAMKASLQQQ